MLTLHYAPRTISIAIAIVLEHLDVDYQAIMVDFSKAEQTQAPFLTRNPKGRVPVLETPHGILTETAAILEYVAPSLVPNDVFYAAKMRELMAYLNGTMHPNHAHGLRGIRWADQNTSFADMKQKVPVTMAASCAHIENTLSDLPFETGQLQVLSDAYLYVVLTWLKGDGVDIANYPRLATFQTAMDAQPAVKTVQAKGML